jgi:hypothetical protein
MGGNFGGSGNFNMHSMNTIVPYEGMINENYFPIRQRETNLSASLELFKSITKNPFNKQLEYFIGLLVKSKYDGIGRQLDEIDLSIALDVSGSMDSYVVKKPTFKEMYEKGSENNANQNNVGKNRLTMAKDCLFKLIESMTDKMKMALTTFDTRSTVIMPLSPKQELKSISHRINSIESRGGTDLTEALKGAADCLAESTAKFKRVIIITDGWDDRGNFMDLARELNKKDILITLLSICESSNSNMYSNFSELKGCNYYFILNEEDMEKYLIKQLNYICFPVLYDMKVNFESTDADLIKTIGCGEKNEIKNEGEAPTPTFVTPKKELINTTTVFPSDLKQLNGIFYQEGGLILLKIKPKSLDKNCKINLKLSYNELEGNHLEMDYIIDFTTDELRNGVNSPEMKKGLAIYYFSKFLRKIKKYMNLNVQFTHGGPVDTNTKKPEKKYFDFLSRNFENYDKIKIYFNDNYVNDINEYQKEYYVKNLDEEYANCEKKMKEQKNNEIMV